MSTASDTSQKKPGPDSEPERKYGWKEQAKFLKAFWDAPSEKAKARWMLAGIVGLTVAEIALTAGVGFGFKLALDALVAKNAVGFALSGAGVMGGIVGQSLAGNGREYMQLNLSQNWRGWLTKQFSDAWLGGKSYLRLQHSKKYTQNPDQRIAETIGNVTGTTLSLGLGLMRSVVGVAVFSVMLWHIAPVMLAAAVGCAVVAHGATHWAGGSMRKIWRSLMDTEAKFRHALTRVRDNAKPIALGGLENVEKKVLKEEFNTLDEKRREFYKFNWRMGMVGSLNWSTASVVPIALSAPKFFAGAATLGSLELTRQAYGQFYQAISWFPQGYTQIAGWQANVGQLMDFQRDLEENKSDITSRKAAEPKPAPAVPAPKVPVGPKP
jgi:putative ATP-binding cassette transporter